MASPADLTPDIVCYGIESLVVASALLCVVGFWYASQNLSGQMLRTVLICILGYFVVFLLLLGVAICAPNQKSIWFDIPAVAIVIMSLVAYIAGGAVVAATRYGWRCFYPPLTATLTAVALFIIMVGLLKKEHTELKQAFIDVISSSLWPIAVIIIFFTMWARRFDLYPYFRRLRKAEFPGGFKLETGDVAKLPESLHPWRRAITNFSDLINELCTLIDETPDHEYIRFLAYTPLIGFLMRPEREWNQLRDRINSKFRIHFICLDDQDIKKWHADFEGRESPRCNGQIGKALLEQATLLAQAILAERARYYDSSLLPVRIKFEELPNYHMFFNEKRAIVVMPVFVPQVLNNTLDSGHYSDTPIQMFGFETTDPWTVYMIKKEFDRLVNVAKLKASIPAS